MNRGRGKQSGYTIIETLIFLAVSAGMFVAAMALIGGQQAKTEFTQAVRDTESALQDMANDIATGYYANVALSGGYLNCSVASGAINLGVGPDKQGANNGCIFIGKTVQFAPDSANNGAYSVITLIGKQRTGTGAVGQPDSTNYNDSTVKAVAPTVSNPSIPNGTQSNTLGGGVTIGCVIYSDTSGATPSSDRPCGTSGFTKIDTITFMTTFRGTDVQGRISSGGTHTDLVVPNSTRALGRSLATAAGDINSYKEAIAPVSGTTYKNPKGGVYVCLQSNGTKQFGLLALGGQNGGLTISSKILGGSCS